MNRAEKNEEIQLLEGYFKNHSIAIQADPRGLTVGQITKLRADLRKIGATARVSKNTFIRLAAKRSTGESAVEDFAAKTVGPSLVVFCEDPVAPAKVLAAFAKDHEKFSVKAAWFEGKCLDKAGVEALSKMPGKLELLATLLRLINTPATNLVRLLAEPGSQVARVLEAQRKKLEGAPA